jgi:uncharacterized protein
MQLRVWNQSRGTLLAEAATVADTSKKRREGLLRHESLPRGAGLLISPCEAVHTFGMKFAIDVVFLDRRHRVLKIRPAMGKRRISICLRAASVLELPAGTAAETGTGKGDQLVLERQAE